MTDFNESPFVATLQAEALNEQTTKVQLIQQDIAQAKADAEAKAQLEAELAKEKSALWGMQVHYPLSIFGNSR